MGKIVPNGVRLQAHEYDTVLYFTEMGKEVELIKPSYTPGRRNADFVMDGVEWEMKAVIKSSRRAVERLFYEASRQASNVVIDFRQVSGEDNRLLVELEKCFRGTRRVRRLYVILKNGKWKFYKK